MGIAPTGAFRTHDYPVAMVVQRGRALNTSRGDGRHEIQWQEPLLRRIEEESA